jgi:hypothetical protein
MQRFCRVPVIYCEGTILDILDLLDLQEEKNADSLRKKRTKRNPWRIGY